MAKLSLRLYIDVEKNEVILAEAGRDFVDTLFSVLTLPVGTIVRMLKQHKKESQLDSVGCLNNLYRNVEDMSIENFRTEECKQMLLYPRSVKDEECRKLKLNVNDTQPLKYFMCPTYRIKGNCNKFYSNFNTSRCSCGYPMNTEVCLREVKPFSGDIVDGIFVSGDSVISGRASFVITKLMKVSMCSPGLFLKTLGALGCADVNNLAEMRIDVGAEEVLTFIECLPSSDSPLTDAFLKKKRSHVISKMHTVAGPVLADKPGVVVPGEAITVNVIMRKVDRKILYVECGGDFMDLLFTFLVVPFEYLLEVSTGETVAKCVSNFVRSYRDFSSPEGTDIATSEYKLPLYYHCQKQLLNVTPTATVYRCLKSGHFYSDKPMGSIPFYSKSYCSGFVKEGLKFMVTDDLCCSPLELRFTLSYLKKLQIDLDDIDEQVISIGKLEAKRLLRASFMTSSALSTAFGKLVAKKPKEEVRRKLRSLVL